jgi:hypothetical protein
MADLVTVASGALIELGKVYLQGYFQSMRMAGKTEEEINQLYEAEKAQFQQNRPENLPNP